MQLSQEKFNQAAAYMKAQARPLEQALYEFHFADGEPDAALKELAPFQNADGGFGHGLEPDAQTASSSALHTALGLRLLKELGYGPDNQKVQKATGYLLDTYDADKKVWRIMPPEVNDAPHAPWWNDEDGSLEQSFNSFLINPRAEIVTLLSHYSSLVPAAMLADVTEDTVQAIEGGGEEWHDLINAVKFAEAPTIAAQYGQRLEPRLRQLADKLVSRDPASWTEYGAQPLTLASTPQSLLAPYFAPELQANLDFVIGQQSEDGSWSPNWSWFGAYPEDWEKASKDWAGMLTLDTLRSLKAFGRID